MSTPEQPNEGSGEIPIVKRGRWELLCSSESQGTLCDKPFGHKGVHRSWEGIGSWGTSTELAETLEADRG